MYSPGQWDVSPFLFRRRYIWGCLYSYFSSTYVRLCLMCMLYVCILSWKKRSKYCVAYGSAKVTKVQDVAHACMQSGCWARLREPKICNSLLPLSEHLFSSIGFARCDRFQAVTSYYNLLNRLLERPNHFWSWFIQKQSIYIPVVQYIAPFVFQIALAALVSERVLKVH